jgi:hypothetical protein
MPERRHGRFGDGHGSAPPIHPIFFEKANLELHHE